MNKRQLGKTDLYIAPLVFGGNVFGWTIDEPASFQLLDAFTAGGFDMIDTADVYSRWVPGNKGGESERIIGHWMKQRNNRHEVLIATKVGSDMGQGKNVSKNYILKAVEDSLQRLQTDHIDLYQTHFDDEATSVEETLEAYATLVKAGKVRWIGTSNMNTKRISASLKYSLDNDLPTYQTLQPQYNLYDREKFETDYQQLCLDKNIGVIPYYSLASGFLTGKYRTEADLSKSARGGGIKKYMDQRGYRILSALDAITAKYNVEPATIALAWLMAQPTITAPIASATQPAQLTALMTAADIALSTEEIAMLNEASAY